MVYVSEWEPFAARAEKIYMEAPQKTRLTAKYDHTRGKLVLKCTDDVVCLKYATDQAHDLKRLEKRNNRLITYMCGMDPSDINDLDGEHPRPPPHPAHDGPRARAHARALTPRPTHSNAEGGRGEQQQRPSSSDDPGGSAAKRRRGRR